MSGQSVGGQIRTPRKRRRGGVEIPLEKYPPLIGDNEDSHEHYEYISKTNLQLALSARRTRELLKPYEARTGRKIVLVEDLLKSGAPRATFERESESTTHYHKIQEAIAVLRRQGFAVYPGGAGLDGIYSMADILAISPEGEPLFVEVLTKASIKRGAHVRKLQLAKPVPFCFLGELPNGFLKDLPSNAFCIAHPRAALTEVTRKIPTYYLNAGHTDLSFSTLIKRGRSVTRVEVGTQSLRLQEDVSAFLFALLCERLHWRRSEFTPDVGVEVNMPQAGMMVVPFERTGMSYSNMYVAVRDSQVTLRLGTKPVVIEIRGSNCAARLIEQWLSDVGSSIRLCPD